MSSREIGSMRRSSIERLRLEVVGVGVAPSPPRMRSCFLIESDEYDAHGVLDAGPLPVLAGDETESRPVDRWKPPVGAGGEPK
jgi:hypothetical protein